MNEINAAKQFAIATLKAHAMIAHPSQVGSRVYYGLAPRDAVYPLILIALTDAVDNVGMERARLATEPVLTIRGVHDGEDATISGRIAGWIDEALVGLPGSTGAQGETVLDGATYFVGGISREAPTETVEPVGEIQRIYTGGIYRFFVERIA